jgi:hypothetical protein
MPVYTLGYVYQLGSFSTTGGNIVPPNEQGATAQGNPPFNFQLNTGATALQIQVNDTADANFDEINSGSQTLAAPITIDGVTYPVGARIVINYELTGPGVPPVYSITIGANNTGNNTTTALISTSPLVPGTQYTYTTEANIGNNSIPYADFVCFATGTLIRTEDGARPVESLAPGDRVWTLDHGFQPLRWSGEKRVCGIGPMAPVLFDAEAIGNDRPLRLSAQHRVLVRGPRAEMLFGEAEVLVPAKALVDGVSVHMAAVPMITYVHLLFDAHEVLEAEGAQAESLYLGPVAEGAVGQDARAEIAALFPDLDQRRVLHERTARPVVSARQGRLLAGAAQPAKDTVT